MISSKAFVWLNKGVHDFTVNRPYVPMTHRWKGLSGASTKRHYDVSLFPDLSIVCVGHLLEGESPTEYCSTPAMLEDQ